MASTARLGVLLVWVLAVPVVALGEREAASPPLVNWNVPATSSPSGSSKIRALTDISSPVPFITTAPCRQYNSLLATPLLQGVNRPVTLTGAPCGIPSTAVAVSVNITVFNITGATGNGVFKVDTVTPPAVAWINYPPTEAQRGNAGVVALNASSQIIVQVAQGAGQVDFVVDTNGYYGSAPGTQGNSFNIDNNSSNYSIKTTNSSTTCTAECGIVGHIASTVSAPAKAYAVAGFADGTSGTGIGVFGTSSTQEGDSAGVYGMESTGKPVGATGLVFAAAGVRGDSRSNVGVLGLSDDSCVLGLLLNSSGTVIGEGRLGARFGTAADTTTGPWGVFASGNLGASGAKHFVEPHPADASKVIVYSSIEGRTVDTYFRGSAQTVNRQAVIDVPEDFRIVTDEEDLTVQLTPVGALATMAVMSQDLNRIVVKSSTDVRFHYLIQGIRRAFKSFQPVGKGYEFMPRSPSDRMPGYLTEEAQRRLISNGTYNEDGTVNMATAERLGWVKTWADREAAAQSAAREARQAANAKPR